MLQNSRDVNPLSAPLGNIALAFSGGGFRAAAFSLGTLSYLNQLKIDKGDGSEEEHSLLENVSYISSTSGGSFTNALYSAYIHQGKTFIDVYHKLKKNLAGQDLLKLAVEILDDDAQWNQPGNGKKRNIINAFAIAYDIKIFEGETFGIFWEKKYVPEFEVCFNSTEFYRGLCFRFQTEGDNNPYQVTGNKYLYFNTEETETLKKIKLADMVAASSCFPSGFEPIVYPDDFSYSKNGIKLTVEELQKAMLSEDYQEVVSSISKPIGFMDGGITDNQGLHSAMLADEKRRNRKDKGTKTTDPFDLIIITDVASYFMDDYDIPNIKTNSAWRLKNVNYFFDKVNNGIKTFSKAINWSMILSIIVLMLSISAIVLSANRILINIAYFICGVTAIMLILTFLIKAFSPVKWILNNKANLVDDAFIKKEIKEQKKISETILIQLIHFLKVSKIALLEQMLKARIDSTFSLVMDINLKQTRRLIYDLFYDDPKWTNKRMPNFIYTLSSYNRVCRTNRINNVSQNKNIQKKRLAWEATNEDKNLLLNNCEKLNEVAEAARTMDTTLWFNENDVKEEKLKKIIATGQFTTCSNLLEYLISLERKEIQFDANITEQLSKIKRKLTEDFIHFKSDPFYLYKTL